MREKRSTAAALVIGSVGGLLLGYGLAQTPVGLFTLTGGLVLLGIAFREAFL